MKKKLKKKLSQRAEMSLPPKKIGATIPSWFQPLPEPPEEIPKDTPETPVGFVEMLCAKLSRLPSEVWDAPRTGQTPFVVIMRRFHGPNGREDVFLPSLRAFWLEAEQLDGKKAAERIAQWKAKGLSPDEDEEISRIYPTWLKRRRRDEAKEKGRKSGLVRRNLGQMKKGRRAKKTLGDI